jgi:ABC-type lipoprotein export system ATPase subunit
MPGAAISIRGLTHRYRRPGGHGDLTVLDDLDLDVAPGEHVVVTGVSGSGKSTLLALVGGLDRPREGSIVVGGRDLRALSRNGLADYRRQTVGFVFQHFGLLDTLTAAENVELAGILAGRRPRERRDRAAQLLDAVGLAGRADHRATALSGGERQRVAVARALVNDPRLVLADEPTGNLDDESSERVVHLLEALPAEHGCTLVVATHDHRLTTRAPRHLRLTAGRLHETRPPGCDLSEQTDRTDRTEQTEQTEQPEPTEPAGAGPARIDGWPAAEHPSRSRPAS